MVHYTRLEMLARDIGLFGSYEENKTPNLDFSLGLRLSLEKMFNQCYFDIDI